MIVPLSVIVINKTGGGGLACAGACEPAACLRLLCLWGKTKVLHDELGSRGNSIVAWRNVTGGPGRGRGPLGALRTHGSQQTHKLASQKTATYTNTHTRTHTYRHTYTHSQTLSLFSIPIPLTHTPLPGASVLSGPGS